MIGEREFHFAVETWGVTKPSIKPLKMALLGLGVVGVALGMKVSYEGLNAHFDSVQVSEDTRLRQLEIERLNAFENYGNWIPSKESIDDVFGPPQWIRPTIWEK